MVSDSHEREQCKNGRMKYDRRREDKGKGIESESRGKMREGAEKNGI